MQYSISMQDALSRFREEESFISERGKWKFWSQDSIKLTYSNSGEFQWWLDAIPKAVSNTHTLEIDFIINADPSESRWGATDGVNPAEEIWSEHYKAYHINYLELKAIHLAIRAYSNLWKGCKHIRIKSDITTAIAYVNNMGGSVFSSCDRLAKEIWTYCSERKIWLSEKKIMKQSICPDSLMTILNGN